MMKKTKIALSIGMLLAASTAYAEEIITEETASVVAVTPAAEETELTGAELPFGFSLSGSAMLTSDYIWRGVSQTRNGAAMQGSIDLKHESGFYLGAWGSNVDWDGGASMELDAYVGFSREVSIKNFTFTYDIGWLHYDYPMETGTSNFNEVYFGISGSPFENLNTSLYYYQDVGVENKFGIGYVDVAADYTLPSWAWGVVVSGHYGYYANKDSSLGYSDWKVGISKEIIGLTFAFDYTDTNADSNAIKGSPQTNGDHYVFSVSREFGGAVTPMILTDTLTATVTATLATDYIWRGVSQTGNGPAIQGSFEVAHSYGFYIGAWGSNVEFHDGSSNSLELDAYFGFRRDVTIGTMNLNYDVGFLHYDYPLATGDSNFNEIYAGLTLTPIDKLNTSIYYYHDIGVENIGGIGYLDLGIDYQLPYWAWDMTTSAHFGSYFKRDSNDTYTDWKVAISKEISIVNVEVAYTDTSDNQYNSRGTNLSDARVVGSISASL